MSIVYNNSNSASINQSSVLITVADPGSAGDFLLAVWECDGGGQSCIPPDGTWIQLFSGSLFADNATYTIWYKKSAVGSGNYTFTADNTLNMGLVILAWTGADSSNPIQDTPVTEVHDDGRTSPANVIAPTITTTVNNCQLIWVGIGDPNNNNPGITFGAPSGYTSRIGFSDSSGWDVICIADKAIPTAGVIPSATGTFTRASTGFGVAGFHISIVGGGPSSTGAFLSTNFINYI